MTAQAGTIQAIDTAFGLDLAGYSTDGSAFARADRRGASLNITVYRNHCFGKRARGKRPLAGVVRAESDLLTACLRHSRVVVDVPIDLQGLPDPPDPQFVWELTKRPVDYAFTAMPPLAQRIGSYVARFRRLWRSLPSDLADALDSRLFETYPAASLALLGLKNKNYKGTAFCGDVGRWLGQPDESPAQSNMNRRLATNLNDLGWIAPAAEMLSHDEFDAALCAVTGVAEQGELLARASLKERIEQAIDNKCPVPRTAGPGKATRTSPPSGYRLLMERPPKATIEVVRTRDDADLLRAVSAAGSVLGRPGGSA